MTSRTTALLVLVMVPTTAIVTVAASAETPDEILARAHDDQLVPALREELQRNVERLALPDAPELYHLRYHLLRSVHTSASASYGTIVEQQSAPNNGLAVEVRVGSAQLDNTGFGGWETGMTRTSLPDELTPLVLRQEAWLATDRAYKDAVEQYARKVASWSPPPDHPGDFQLQPKPSRATADAGRTADPEALVELTRQLSAAFPADLPLVRAEVHLAHGAGTVTVLDSEGLQVRSTHEELDLRAVAHVRAADGSLLSDHCTWIVRSADQLPPADKMAAEIRAMARQLAARAAVEAATAEYVGPVIFEDAAAAELFRHLLVGQLEGTPPVLPFDSVFGNLGEGFGSDPVGGAGDVRVGRRVLPAGWTVIDDPTLDDASAASFSHDAEGTEARVVTLVTDGIVRDLLMSRIPRKDLGGSNGHARGSPGQRLGGRAAMTVITPDRARSRQQLRKQALQMARSYGLDHVIVVRRIEDDQMRFIGDFPAMTFSYGGDDDAAAFRLPRPLIVERLYDDGHTEPVRGLAFAGVHRWVLRDIVAAGPEAELTYLAPFQAGQAEFEPNAGMPSHLSAPEVLIGEMELVPVSGDPRDVPVVPAP